jgi:hypothetical protein
MIAHCGATIRGSFLLRRVVPAGLGHRGGREAVEELLPVGVEAAAPGRTCETAPGL